MEERYEIVNDQSMNLSAGFTAFEAYLQNFGLPTENVIAPPEDNVIKLRKSKNSHGIEKDLVTIFMNKM